jgi:AsmA protein
VNARGNHVIFKEDMKGIQINPLLRELVQKDILEGRGDVQLDVTGSGATMSALKRSLAGSARMQLKDGAYKGINLVQVFRRARAAIGGKTPAAANDAAQKTDFTELSASFSIKAGVAHNEDLVLKSPFLRSGGSGDLDIAAATLDYVVRPTLVASTAGQEGRDKLSGITVPVRLHGPLDAIKYEVDTRALVSTELRERLGERLKPGDALRDQVRDRLRGLINR